MIATFLTGCQSDKEEETLITKISKYDVIVIIKDLNEFGCKVVYETIKKDQESLKDLFSSSLDSPINCNTFGKANMEVDLDDINGDICTERELEEFELESTGLALIEDTSKTCVIAGNLE